MIQTSRSWRRENGHMLTMPDVPVLPNTEGDDRWEQWVAKGAAHDADVRHRGKVIAVLIASTAAIALALSLGLN